MLNQSIVYGKIFKEFKIIKSEEDKIIGIKFILMSFRDFVNENNVREADFIPCVAWGNTAEFILNNFNPKDLIIVTGKLTSGNYKGKDDKTVYTFELLVKQAYFVGYKDNSNNQQNRNENSNNSNNNSNSIFSQNNLNLDDILSNEIEDIDSSDLPF